MNSKSWQTEERNDDESDLEDWERASSNPEFSRLECFPCQHREMEESNGASESRNPQTNMNMQKQSATMNSMSSSEILETSTPPSNNAQPLNSKSFTTPPDKETSSMETRLVTPHTQVARSLSSVIKTTPTRHQHLVDERGLYKINPYATSPRTRKRSRVPETTTNPMKDDSAIKTRASIATTSGDDHPSSGRDAFHHTTVRIKQESPEPGEEGSTFGQRNFSFLENETSNLCNDHRSYTNIRIKQEENSEEEEEQEQHEGAKKTAIMPNASLQPTTLFVEQSTTDQNGLIKSENKLQDNDGSSHPRIRRPVLPPCTTASLIDPRTGLYKANPYATKTKRSISNARKPSSSS